MRQATLKTYTKDRLTEYYGKPLYFTKLVEDSKTDIRLAEAAQAFYMSRGEVEKANHFSFKTKMEYFTLDDFMKSNQKYVRQFNGLNNAMVVFKREAQIKINDELAKLNKTRYWLAKLVGTSQSNIDQFLVKGNLNAISVTKLNLIYKLLNLK